jgi:hypothetical protein
MPDGGADRNSGFARALEPDQKVGVLGGAQNSLVIAHHHTRFVDSRGGILLLLEYTEDARFTLCGIS